MQHTYPDQFLLICVWLNIHLCYAEALAQTGNLQKACDEMNKVRARVGLGKVEAMNPELNLTANKDNSSSSSLRNVLASSVMKTPAGMTSSATRGLTYSRNRYTSYVYGARMPSDTDESCRLQWQHEP